MDIQQLFIKVLEIIAFGIVFSFISYWSSELWKWLFFGEGGRSFEKISKSQWEKDTKSIPSMANEIIKYRDIILPKRSTSHSAGYDIFSPFSFVLKPGESINIPTGFKVYMRQDEKLVFHPRSGLGFKYFIRLANTTGIVDSDYIDNEGNEGHCWVKIRNEGGDNVLINKGTAISQCIFEKFLLVDGDNFKGEKRTGGFGSTDKK